MQSLIVDQTHRVLVRGKPVLQKNYDLLRLFSDEDSEGELVRDDRGEGRVPGRGERQPPRSHAHHCRHDGATRGAPKEKLIRQGDAIIIVVLIFIYPNPTIFGPTRHW